MPCTTDSPIGAPYAFNNRVVVVDGKVGVIRVCDQCEQEFFDAVDDDHKSITSNYVDHFIRIAKVKEL